MEYLSVFDANKRSINKKVPRNQKLEKGEYYLITEICVISNDGLLVTRRASTKKTDPNKWDIIGGHVQYGESSREAAQREIQEELGIHIAQNELVYLRTEQNEKLYSDLYLLKISLNVNNIKYQRDEISAIKLVGSTEFLWMLYSKLFSKSVADRLHKCRNTILQNINKRGGY